MTVLSPAYIHLPKSMHSYSLTQVVGFCQTISNYNNLLDFFTVFVRMGC